MRIYRGILTGYNEAFIIDGDKRNQLIKEDPNSAQIIRPILRGRDIKRYGYEFSYIYLIASHNGIPEKDIPAVDISKYPAIKRHLDSYWKQISERSDMGDSAYNLRSCAYMEDFSKPKIVWAELARTGNAFMYDKYGYYVGNTGYVLTLGDQRRTTVSYEYLLAVLNSKSILFFLDRISSKFDETGWRWLKQYVDLLPIPLIPFSQQKEIADQARACMNNPDSNLQKEVDWLVYKLYGFSEIECQFLELM